VSGVLILVVGRVSDIVGRRYFFIGGQLLVVVGSIICAKSNNVNTLIGGTVLTGAAGAGQLLYPLLIQELIPNKHRGLAQGAISVATIPTIGFGPLVARVLVEKTELGWRWCYWLNVIVGGLSLVLYVACYFPPNFHMINSNLTKRQELRELDYGGLVLYSAGLVLVMLAFTWAEGTYPWKSAHVIAPLIVGVFAILAFVLYEAYMPLKQPLLPLRLFKNNCLIPITVVACVAQMVFFALSILFPQQIAALYTRDNIIIGLMSVSALFLLCYKQSF
jgi:MFS family permease